MTLLKRILVVTSLIVVGSLTVAATASAQSGYPSQLPSAEIDCTEPGVGTILVDGATVTIVFPVDYWLCVTNVVVDVNPVLYDGPVPASRLLRLSIPPLAGDGPHAVSVTATLRTGVKLITSQEVTASDLALINGVNRAEIAVNGVRESIAFTGSEVSAPLIAAAVMTGLGGILVAISRKRSHPDTYEV